MGPDSADDPAQEFIPGGVAERVVPRLEAVHVDEGEHERPLRSLRPGHLSR
jgi:hypothetical protein